MGLQNRPAIWLCICLIALDGRAVALAAPTSKRVAIVTGGTRGIGRGISEALAQQVLLLASPPPPPPPPPPPTTTNHHHHQPPPPPPPPTTTTTTTTITNHHHHHHHHRPQGYDLLLTYNTDAAAATESAKSLTSEFGCRVECVGGDVSLAATRDSIFQCCDKKFSGQDLGAVVHNAGQYVGITASNADGLKAQQLGT